MDKNIRNILFALICFTLIFVEIPRSISLNTLGGLLQSKLVLYPLIISFIVTLYHQYKFKNVFLDTTITRKYIIIYLLCSIVSLCFGLCIYQHFDRITEGPISQIDKLPMVLHYLERQGILLDSKVAISLWMVARVFKGLVFEVIYTFGGTYMIYCWYKNDWKVSIEILYKAILCSLVIIFAYCSVEMFYLAGNISAKKVLEIINPYIHKLGENGFWWPPLLWKGQLRSVFAEPSYFGIYAAFCMPFLWLLIIKSKIYTKYIYMLIATVMTFFLILTKARTGFMLHIGELVVFTMLLVYLCNREVCKKGVAVFLCSIVAFVGGNMFINNCMVNKQVVCTSIVKKQATNISSATIGSKRREDNIFAGTVPSKKQVVNVSLTESIKNYVDSNAASLTNPDKRSNRARYSVMEADIKVGLEHPLLGVGNGLRTVYVIDSFSEKALQHNEIKMWLDFNKRLGVLKFGIPKLGEYTSRFCETGILGLLVFLFPAVYLVFSMLCKLKSLAKDEQIYYVMFLTSFAGILASGIGDTINITYCYWVLLGVGYAMCFGRCEENLDNE